MTEFSRTKPNSNSTNKSLEQLAKLKGWSKEDLRKCYDLPKKTLKPGTRIVRMPADLLQDPFKGKPATSLEQGYDALETRFYNNLSRMVANEKGVTVDRRGTATGATNRTNHVRVQIAGAQVGDVRLHVGKTYVDATVNLGGTTKK